MEARHCAEIESCEPQCIKSSNSNSSSKNRFSLFCNNVIATFWERLLAAADDDKAKDCLCDDDGGNVDCHKIPLVSRFIVSFLPLSLDSIDFLLLCFEHLLLLILLGSG